MRKKLLIITVTIFICFLVAVMFFIHYGIKNNKKDITYPVDTNYSTSLLKNVNKDASGNYLVSPYSIKVALSMLRDGANNNTKDQINKVIGSDKINLLKNDAVHIANAMFIKNEFKDGINNSYKQGLIDNYKSDILYDEFTTPNVINDWVKNETEGMIEKVIDEVPDEFIVGLANALAIDVEWKYPFDCIDTNSTEFTKKDGSKLKVETMHKSYVRSDVSYLESDKVKGIIIPYKDSDNLEFVALLPNDNIDDYINNLTIEELDKLEENKVVASDDVHIALSLPRFKYDYDLSTFTSILKNIGIKDAFDSNNADFTTIMSKDSMKKYNIDNIYVSEAVHKTYIDLNEKGTKAAAITYFGLSYATSIQPPKQPKIINIDLDKTFLYMIRDKSTKEILFMGVVDSPNEWKKSTCNNL